MPDPTQAQIGRSGELLVQYRLLKYGIESAAMTTDTGIDLVVYAPADRRAVTVQVKANLKPKPAGGAGRLALDWWLRETSPAEIVALVDLATDSVWMFTHDELVAAAQQHSNGRHHFYFYIEPVVRPANMRSHFSDYARFAIDRRVGELFGVFPSQSAARDLSTSW